MVWGDIESPSLLPYLGGCIIMIAGVVVPLAIMAVRSVPEAQRNRPSVAG